MLGSQQLFIQPKSFHPLFKTTSSTFPIAHRAISQFSSWPASGFRSRESADGGGEEFPTRERARVKESHGTDPPEAGVEVRVNTAATRAMREREEREVE
jgi:hypothetical protein